jgi:hypothetical protein
LDSNASVDAIKFLITKGKNDPMDLDKYGYCLFNGYVGNSDGYLFILNQDEFPVYVNQAGISPLHNIAKCFGYSFSHNDDLQKRLKSWEPVLRRALQLGIPLTENVPGTETALDSLFLYNNNQADSVLLAQEWLLLLSSVGVDIDDYIREEKPMHDSGLLYWECGGGRKRRLIFEEEGSSKKQSIRWEWFYSPEDPAYHVLAEYSAFNDTHIWLEKHWKSMWPFFDVKTIKGLIHKSYSNEEIAEIDSKWAILEARWARQAARRQRRSEYSPRFKKPSRSERRLRVPGAWIKDDLPISFRWPRRRRRIFLLPWWMYLFTLGVAFLMSSRSKFWFYGNVI